MAAGTEHMTRSHMADFDFSKSNHYLELRASSWYTLAVRDGSNLASRFVRRSSFLGPIA